MKDLYDRVVIVIPTYNEKENIGKLIKQIKELLPQTRVFVVDDNSPDGTAFVVEELAGQYEGVKLILRNQKKGLASAYLEAFESLMADTSIDYFVTMDADFSHHPEDLVNLLDHARDNDLVIGSRYIRNGVVENWSLWRRLLSRLGNLYARAVTGVGVSDLTAGFVVYKRDMLDRIIKDGVESEGYAFQIEMKSLAQKFGASIREVPITFRERAAGKSKLSRSTVWEGIVAPWRWRLFRKK